MTDRDRKMLELAAKAAGHHPYKVWIRERRIFFAQHGLPRNGTRKTQKEQLDDLIAMMESKAHWAKSRVEQKGGTK